MRHVLAVLIIGIVGLAITQPVIAADDSPPVHCTIEGFRPFSAKVWRLTEWQRGMPPARVLQAQKRDLACASGDHRTAMIRTWRRDKVAYFIHRHAESFRIRVTPFLCVGNWWATECTIPEHESGYGAGGSNLYGMKDAWALHGCTVFAPTAWDATKREQDICAHRHWVTYGRGGWPPY